MSGLLLFYIEVVFVHLYTSLRRNYTWSFETSDVCGSPPFLHQFGYIIYIINCMYNRIVKFVATVRPAALCFAIYHNNSFLSTHLNGLSK